jgi:hypothetical protein
LIYPLIEDSSSVKFYRFHWRPLCLYTCNLFGNW